MSTLPELMYAILAMDAYNRGYNPGIAGLGGMGSQIGTATVGEDAETLLSQGSAVAAGFYAVAYQWNGETIISYRGKEGCAGGRPGGRGPFVLAKGPKIILAVAGPCGSPARFACFCGAQTRSAQTVCAWFPKLAARLGPAPGQEKTI